ncbi:hypothetical protein [uncultured Clostridium sp.]|uniref:hypothetical protein n=1 Tax=uncultured Clostridium sp. TaxID=59620 RepID=UPI00261D1F23|nr:hypothetical protein [uncultured Clostridium sp.]
MKKILIIGLITITTAISLVGCMGTNKDEPGKDTSTTQGESSDKGNDSSEDKTNDNKKPEVESEDKNDKKPEAEKEDNKKPSTSDKEEVEKEDKTERIFKVVTKDIDYKVVNGKEIKTVGLGVADNIKKILNQVSKDYFDGKTIELKDIETVNNKKIAIVNLGGSKDYWNQRMQGSLGGAITEYTLIENVLQREYKGYWIDGVKFTLDGKQLQESQHAEKLTQTTYR